MIEVQIQSCRKVGSSKEREPIFVHGPAYDGLNGCFQKAFDMTRRQHRLQTRIQTQYLRQRGGQKSDLTKSILLHISMLVLTCYGYNQWY